MIIIPEQYNLLPISYETPIETNFSIGGIVLGINISPFIISGGIIPPSPSETAVAIKNYNKNDTTQIIKIWYGTQEDFINQKPEIEPGVLCFISNNGASW